MSESTEEHTPGRPNPRMSVSEYCVAMRAPRAFDAGNQKTVAAGQAEQQVGKVQNAVGGLKDSIRDVQKGK